MKRIYLFVFVSIFLLSCTKTIDKKIVLTEYEEMITKIKSENTEYSESDFIKANNLLDGLAFRSLQKGSMNTEKTYRQLLNEAKLENEKEAAEIKTYNDELDKLKAIVSVNVKQSQYVEGYPKGSSEIYRTFISEIEVTNQSDKDITGLQGSILVKNAAGDVIKTSYVKLADPDLLPAGKTEREAREYPVLEDYDNIMELKANQPETFKYEWVPELIIFKDGSRMKAPTKPYALSEK